MSFKIFNRKKELIQSYQRLFDTDDGIEVLNDLMEHGYAMRPTNEPDVQKMQINEGKRQLVLYILKNMNENIEQLQKRIENLANARREDV